MKPKTPPPKQSESLQTIILGVVIGNVITIFLVFLLTGLANWGMTNESSPELFMMAFTLLLGWVILSLVRKSQK